MSTRRPRIKASANLALASKRKPKSSTEVIDNKPLIPIEKVESSEPSEENIAESLSESITENYIVNNSGNITTLAKQDLEIYNGSSESPLKSFQEAFKYPQNPDYKRLSAALTTNAEDKTPSDFEDNILHMDLQKSPGFPMSPTKSRQRIRPTPIFGQRRNSFVGTSPSPHTEEETSSGTRQRSSNSTSSETSGSFLMRKLAAGNLGRIRTESGCSTVSESRASSRKNNTENIRNPTKLEYLNRFNGKPPDKSTLKMFDLIYYNPSTNPMAKKSTEAVQTTLSSDGIVDSNIAESSKPPITIENAMPVPQLKLGSNGEMMIDEMSLEIETTAEVEARKVLANSSLIYHDENTAGEGFYKRQKRTKDWSPDETIKFYRCLQTVGTDFSLMLTLFPKRSRRDLKLKFKKEERCNLALINKALLYPGTFNIEDLKEQLDIEENERKEQHQRWLEIKAEEGRVKKQKNILSKSYGVIAPGEEIYQNENITKAKLSKRRLKKTSSDNKPKEERRKKKNTSKTSRLSVDENVLEKELDDLLETVSNDTVDVTAKSDELNEESIKLIIGELVNGTLAFVTSEDTSNPTKSTIHEIYIMNKETNELSEKPLDLPEEVIDAIRAVITS